MNHMDKIAAQLPEYGLDAMLITSDSGERYALGFHGEGLLLIAREGALSPPKAQRKQVGPLHHRRPVH